MRSEDYIHLLINLLLHLDEAGKFLVWSLPGRILIVQGTS